MTSGERTAQIEGELNASFGVFDARIDSEQQVLAQQRGGSGDNGSGSASAGGTTGEEEGSGNGAGQQGASGKQGDGKNGQSSSGREDGQSAKGNSTQGGGGGYGGGARGGSGPNTAPADIPDGSDDDIVARQLREAAMKETDPELREKLWEEYRNYKKSAR
jgi:hypothetical protein